MSFVRISEQASSDLIRLYEFLAKYDFQTADRANDAIIASFEILETMPMGCPFVPNRKDLRKLIITFGESGYIAFFNYDELTDTSVITKIKHQREKYNPKSV